MTKRKRFLLGAGIILLLFSLLIGRGLRSRGTSTKPAAGMVATVERGDLDVKVSGTGTVAAAAREEVRTAAAGKLTLTNLEAGQAVAKGELLAKLEVQDADTQIESTKLELKLQEQELANLKRQKTSAVVSAPQQGEILWLVKQGERVQEGMPLATVQERGRLLATGRFAAEKAAKIAVGQAVSLAVAGHPVPYAGTVTAVGNVPRSGGDGSIQYDVSVEIANNGALAGEAQGELTVITPEEELVSLTPVTLTFPEAVQVRAAMAGVVKTTLIPSGTLVQPGDNLVQLEDAQRAEQLAAQITSAELRLKQAQLNLANLQKQQQTRQESSKIIAPLSGTVVLPEKTYAVGDDLTLGALLATIIDYQQLEVVIPVDELDVTKVKPGQTVALIAEALPDKQIAGEVKQVAHEGMGQGGVSTFDVTITINDTTDLKVGMTVSADILVDSRQQILLIPIEALSEVEGKTVVTLAPVGAEEPREVEVQTGVYDTMYIEVVAGLTAGQELLIPDNASGRGLFGRMQMGPPQRGAER